MHKNYRLEFTRVYLLALQKKKYFAVVLTEKEKWTPKKSFDK